MEAPSDMKPESSSPKRTRLGSFFRNREMTSRTLIVAALSGHEVLDEEELSNEITTGPLSMLWDIPEDRIASLMEESFRVVIERIALETAGSGDEVDYEGGVELIYENPPERERFIEEAVRRLREEEEAVWRRKLIDLLRKDLNISKVALKRAVRGA
ncbi:hypothetical protein AKJ57_03125 [candidate division MSBL1 archaeon SCGC-AAA259A05]|uniref:Uncharacterized protein n=1 Tax=candidate division MSBL1 archaeon SCGC-AAA259A05 TaxID=1698259 RepID=A0A133U9R7_9EURY|nr:hypothetical protein AKJ57_03125 [candidate division MSBL1 archaeon SCGC-AAA259A05]